MGILQTGTRAAHRGGDGVDRLALADDALGQRVLHLEELLALALEHAIDGNAGPARDDAGDLVRRHRLLDHRALLLLSLDLF